MKRTALAIVLASAAMSAQATETDYTYVQAGYNVMNVRADLFGASIDESLSGFNVKGSFGFGESFYAIAGYRVGDESFDDGFDTAKIELAEINAGLGFHTNIAEKTDFIAEVEYINDELTVDFNDESESIDDNGFRVATGIRTMFTDKFELTLKLNYADVGDFGSGFGYNLGAVYRINETFGVFGAFDRDDRDGVEVGNWSIGARVSF